MTKIYHCLECGNKFQNGEIVATSLNGNYFHASRGISPESGSCAMKTSNSLSKDKKLYYNGNFYNTGKLERLEDKINLVIDFNTNNNGDIIKGSNLKFLIELIKQ